MGTSEGKLAYLCFSSCAQSSHFPARQFCTPDHLALFLKLLNSPSIDVIDASLGICKSVGYAIPDALQYFIENGIIEKMHFLNNSIQYASMTALLSSHIHPKIEQVLNLIPIVLSSDETDILNTGFLSIRYINNNCPQLQPRTSTILLNHSKHFFSLSDIKFEEIAKQYFSLLAEIPLPNEFIRPILQKMLCQEGTKVILYGNLIFRKQKQNWLGIADDFLTGYLIGLVETDRYDVQKSCIMTIMLYYHLDTFDARVILAVIKFLDDSLLCSVCLEFLTKNLEYQFKNPEFLKLLENALPMIEDLVVSEDDNVSNSSEKFLDMYSKALQQLSTSNENQD
ncbi:hypothetical protein GPJ56_006737 [Histomonas meleagridis]|uniref:uncharacterized protein n=1 Tax=Histomonas meleagridis TaxID=135588 RepID=UPI00355AA9A6|nr:hypothetical protein GPJ56_006737 [Histomonas meleagridis]KAH0806968.1 hypothetical protein GO595_000144 [Histomonas meleagridis]